jgi:glycogen synthase
VRILILAQFYPPDIGGEERHVRNLAASLAGRGHDVDVVTTALPAAPPGITHEAGVRVTRVSTLAQRLGHLYSDPNRPHAMPWPDPSMGRAIESLVNERRYDVAHAHNWIVNSAITPSRHGKVPLVMTLHDYSHVCATKRLMHLGTRICPGPALGRCLQCASRAYGPVIGMSTVIGNRISAQRRSKAVSAFITVSSAVAVGNQLSELGLPFTVIPNFIADELLEAEVRPCPDGPLLFLGDATRDKGIEVLIDAVQRLPAKPHLLIAGRQAPDVRVGDRSGTRVLGPMPHQDVMSLVRSASIVLVPSRMPDPCPTVVLEAMAAGRPVVASAVGGIVDMVEDGVTGRLVPPNAPGALAAAIADVLAQPDRATTMGRLARQHVRRFTASAVVPRIERVYEDVVAAGASTPASR